LGNDASILQTFGEKLMKTGPSLDFCLSVLALNWRDIVWGMERGCLSWRDAQAFAVHRLDFVDVNDFEIATEIYLLGKNEAARIIELANLAALKEARTVTADQPSAPKWLYLVVKWGFENQALLPDSLSFIQDVYAEFDYPKELEPFVGYLPPTDGWEPLNHSSSENKERLLAHWKSYLNQTSARFSASDGTVGSGDQVT
jgi:hypothetical protein